MDAVLALMQSVHATVSGDANQQHRHECEASHPAMRVFHLVNAKHCLCNAAAPAAGLDASAIPAAAAGGVADAGTDQQDSKDGTAKQPLDPMIS